MAESADAWSLPARHLGHKVLVHDQLASTNDLALALAHDPAHHGLAILARSQAAGRGQYGRSWQAPPDSSVLLSVLLFPPEPLRRPALITAWAAVSVAETIRLLCDLQIRIKWPNDLLAAGKKVCGILTEARAAQHSALVVGIGLNVRQPQAFFDDHDLPLGGSLFTACGRDLKVAEVARSVLAQLDEDYHRLTQGELNHLESLWKWRLGLLGRPVVVTTHQGQHQGRLLDVTFDAVLVQSAAGPLRTFPPESIRHLLPLDQDD